MALSLLPGLVTADLASADHAEKVQELCTAIRREQLAVLPLVTALGPYLTSTTDPVRTRAITVLAEVIAAEPGVVQSSGDVQHLATFFTGRLTDWPAIRGALAGCLALLDLPAAAQGGGPAGPALSAADAVGMMEAFAGHVFVRSLGQQDRALAFSLMDKAMAAHGQALLDSKKVNLLEAVISSVDGEKDPRCLLLGLRCVRCAAELYGRQHPDSLAMQKLEEAAEELFDVTAAYFPVSFTPPPNDPHRITRAQLAADLEATLTATPLFAPHLLPLLLEKLGATLSQAKLDSLSALSTCARQWGFDPLEDHLSALWAGLRAELLPAPGAAAAGAEVQEVAARCLSQCLEAFCAEGQWELLDLLWQDSTVQDIFACLVLEAGAGEGGGAEAFSRRVARVRAGARVLAAACQAGQPAASRIFALALPKVLPLCSAAPGAGAAEADAHALVSCCLALGVLLTLLRAAAAPGVCTAPGDGAEQSVADAAAGAAAGAAGSRELPLLAEALEAALQGLPAGPASSLAGPGGAPLAGAEGGQLGSRGSGSGSRVSSIEKTGAEEEEEEGGAELWPPERGCYSPEREARLRLRAVRAVFSLPAAATAQLPAPAVGLAVERLVGCIVGEPPAAVAFGGGLANGATAALCTLASSGRYAELAAQRALPPLAAAARAGCAATLAAISALAGCHATLRTATLTLLDSSIQELLPAAIAHSPTPSPIQPDLAAGGPDASSPPPQLLARQLLGVAQSVLAAGGAEAEQVDPLARHVLGTIMALPDSQALPAGGGDSGVLGACCAAIFHAVRLPGEQAQHAFLSDSGCLARVQQLASAAASTAPAGGSAAAPAQTAAGSSTRALQLAACAAVLAALRPAVLASAGLSAEQLGGISGALLDVALAPEGGMGTAAAGAAEGAAEWAALAVATLLNKWQPDSPEFHGAIHRLLEGRLLPLTLGAPGVPEPETAAAAAATLSGRAAVRRAWACLALAARGLVMRGHPAGDGVLAGVLAMLSEAEAELASAGGSTAGAAGVHTAGTGRKAAAAQQPKGGQQQDPPGGVWAAHRGWLVVWEAARFFGCVLACPVVAEGAVQEEPGASEPARCCRPDLGPETHAAARPLWQQRVFMLQFGALLRSLGARPSAAQPVGAGAGEGPAPPLPSPLLLALAHLIQAAPAAVLRTAWAQVLPWVPRCLSELLTASQRRRGQGAAATAGGAGSGSSSQLQSAEVREVERQEKELALSLLGMLCEALMTEEGRRLCEELLPTLAPALLGALGYAPSFKVRERGAQALLLLVQLPYALLHPHRAAVVSGLTLALDDSRRVVRLQAAQARQAWVL